MMTHSLDLDKVTNATVHNGNDSSALLKVAIMVSGNGSNLQVLIDAMQASELPINLVGVISNNDKAYAITRAKQAGIAVAVLSHITAEQASKPESIGKRMGIKTFERHANAQLTQWQPDLIVLAGFMRILNPEFIEAAPSPMINLHPSLLPKYKGLDTHQRAIDASEQYHGCSIHIVTAELDGGQVLTQAVLEVTKDDDSNMLQTRVQKLEHQLLPWTVLLIAKGVLDINQIAQNPNLASGQYLPALPYQLLSHTKSEN